MGRALTQYGLGKASRDISDIRVRLSGITLPSSALNITTAVIEERSSDVAETVLVSEPGLYLIGFYSITTKPDLTAGYVYVWIRWRDVVAHTGVDSSDLRLLGEVSSNSAWFVTQYGGAITYEITHDGSYGTAKYSAYIFALKLASLGTLVYHETGTATRTGRAFGGAYPDTGLSGGMPHSASGADKFIGKAFGTVTSSHQSGGVGAGGHTTYGLVGTATSTHRISGADKLIRVNTGTATSSHGASGADVKTP